MTVSRTEDWKRGYNSGYVAGRRRAPNVVSGPRSRYSARVHRRLLEVHERRWEAMHSRFLERGRDDVYLQLREEMIQAARAVRRYCEETGKVRPWLRG